MTFDGLKYEKEKFQRRTISLNPNEIEWVFNRIVKDNPNLEDYKVNKKHEEELLRIINFLIYDFEKTNPSNIREYVEKELKKKEYDSELAKINQRIGWKLFGNDVECDKISREIDVLLVEADKEFQGFSKDRGLMISDMKLKIMAYRTKGAVGHMGILKTIRERLERERKGQTEQP